MSLHASVGKSNNRRAAEAGAEAASLALAGIGGVSPALLVVFCTTGYEPERIIAAVRSVVGDAPLVGCTAEGVITQDGSDEGSHAVAVMALGGEGLSATTHRVEGFAADPEGCGRTLARDILAADPTPPKLVLLFPDGLTGNSTVLIDALSGELPEGTLVAGGTAGDMLRLEKVWQFADGQVITDGAVVAALRGSFRSEIVVSHGCDLVGNEATITRAEGTMVYEVDGRPAWDVYARFLGESEKLRDPVEIAHLCLAERLPVEAETEYGDHIIRTPLGLDREAGALNFPGGLTTGTPVRMTRRNPDRVAARARRAAERIVEKNPDEWPTAVFQFDCAGRGGLLFGPRTTEQVVEPLQQVLGRDLPWLGAHTFGEIAPVGPKTYFHNLTVVLVALFEEAPAS